MQYVLLVVVCTLATCFPELTKDDWKYKSFESCVRDGYYKSADVASTLIDINGFKAYQLKKYKFTFYCIEDTKYKGV